jgi:type IV secretory pathway VirB6-like protein
MYLIVLVITLIKFFFLFKVFSYSYVQVDQYETGQKGKKVPKVETKTGFYNFQLMLSTFLPKVPFYLSTARTR